MERAGPIDDAGAIQRDLAAFLINQGRVESAIAVLESALEGARAGGDDASVGEAELLFYQAYRWDAAVGEHHARLARLHAERATVAFRRAGNDRRLADALACLAILAAEERRVRDLDFTLARIEELDNALGLWWRSYTAALLDMNSDPNSAIRELRRCLVTIDVHREHLDHWRAQCLSKLEFLTGETTSFRERLPGFRDAFVDVLRAARDGDAVAADERLRFALEKLEEMRAEIRSPVKQLELSSTTELIYTGVASTKDHGGDHAGALDVVELNTSRSLMSRAAMRWLWTNSPQNSFEMLGKGRRRIARLVGARGIRRSGDDPRALLMALKRHRETTQGVEETLVRLVPPPHQFFVPSPTATTRSRLAPDDAIVVVAPSGSMYVVDHSQVRRVAEIDMDSVNQASATFHSLAAVADSPGTGGDLEAAAETIVATCLNPIRAVLADKKRVFFVPCGRMWGVPLGSLGADPLSERHDIAYVPSLSIAGRLLFEPSQPSRRIPTFFGRADPDGTLPSSSADVHAAATHYYNPHVIMGPDADTGHILMNICDADVVHLACHGGFWEEYPELSFLHLGGRAPEPELLFVQDLDRMQLRARLVVLAACHAGNTVALPGSEYVGFPAAFLLAGARSVLAPLWEVEDRSTATFMEVFYGCLARQSIARALREAQTKLRGDPRTAHPYHWAPFQLFGLPS